MELLGIEQRAREDDVVARRAALELHDRLAGELVVAELPLVRDGALVLVRRVDRLDGRELAQCGAQIRQRIGGEGKSEEQAERDAGQGHHISV